MCGSQNGLLARSDSFNAVNDLKNFAIVFCQFAFVLLFLFQQPPRLIVFDLAGPARTLHGSRKRSGGGERQQQSGEDGAEGRATPNLMRGAQKDSKDWLKISPISNLAPPHVSCG